jgi:hypothetical protein
MKKFSKRYDIIIVGAGFFGAKMAIAYSKLGYRVLLVDSEKQIMSRASFYNQARVHNGYHYPRSLATAWSSHDNYARFIEDYGDCVFRNFEHLYAIPRENSKVSSYQFKYLCDIIGLPCREVSQDIAKLFNKGMVENVFLVEECAIDNNKLRAKVAQEMASCPSLEFRPNTRIDEIRIDDEDVIMSQHEGKECFISNRVFNVTYAGLNRMVGKLGFPPVAVKNELTELCLVHMPDSLKRYGITVMDGDFFSCMPAPAHGCHSLTHVRYTPHASWISSTEADEMTMLPTAAMMESRFIYMKNASSLLVPDLADIEYVRSLYEIKAVPVKNEGDDGRPILFVSHSESPKITSVLGSKLDCIYELEASLMEAEVKLPKLEA